MAEDVRFLVKHLDLHDVTMIGWSLGGAVAAVYARLFSAYRLSRIVFVGASARLAASRTFSTPSLMFSHFTAAASLGLIPSTAQNAKKSLASVR